jgi:Domain of unknown function (DUF1906)
VAARLEARAPRRPGGLSADDTPTSPETPGAKARTPVARQATPGKWFDASVKLTLEQAQRFKAAGFVGVGRYGPLPGNSTAQDLDAEELESLVFDAGLEVLLFQHPRSVNVLSRHSGGADAMWVCQYASSIEYPPAAHVFLDLEGVIGTTAPQVWQYCSDWSRAALQLHFSAGLYVGFSAILGPQDLYALPGFDSYASDAARRRVNVRGVCYQQGAQIAAAGGLPGYDPATVEVDALGGLPLVAAGAYSLQRNEPTVA